MFVKYTERASFILFAAPLLEMVLFAALFGMMFVVVIGTFE
ncbi:MAG: hypothetical protein ACJASI_002300 [Glaciecola sp.]